MKNVSCGITLSQSVYPFYTPIVNQLEMRSAMVFVALVATGITISTLLVNIINRDYSSRNENMIINERTRHQHVDSKTESSYLLESVMREAYTQNTTPSTLTGHWSPTNISPVCEFCTKHPLRDTTKPKSTETVIIYYANDTQFDMRSCKRLQARESCRICSWSVMDDLKKADAVIFRPSTMWRQPLTGALPHPGHQKWVFYEWEAHDRVWGPTNVNLSIWTEINITSGFTNDADLVHYGYAKQCRPDKSWKPSERNYAAEKTRGVLWLVSHCHTPSHREDYVSELQKYLPVDVFGRCGNTTECGLYKAHNSSCLTNLFHKYRFYLAFENSLCEGYYTEKFTRILDQPIIPVVMGLFNYTTLIPKGSYIDVRDFASPRDLARYLKYLTHNSTEYNLYIERKRMVQCQSKYKEPFQCALCRYLHNHKGQKQTGKDGRQFWDPKQKCKTLTDITGFTVPTQKQQFA